MTTPLLEGFPPVVDNAAQLLILGSFPSVQSLAMQQYYANPRNAFWRITGELLGFDANERYENRLAALQLHGIALWDVLHKCRRQGSSDAKIDPKSLIANDFDPFFNEYPNITEICFNGEKAATVFARLVHVEHPIYIRRLPSSSPARAMPLRNKLDAWRVISQL